MAAKAERVRGVSKPGSVVSFRPFHEGLGEQPGSGDMRWGEGTQASLALRGAFLLVGAENRGAEQGHV